MGVKKLVESALSALGIRKTRMSVYDQLMHHEESRPGVWLAEVNPANVMRVRRARAASAVSQPSMQSIRGQPPTPVQKPPARVASSVSVMQPVTASKQSNPLFSGKNYFVLREPRIGSKPVAESKLKPGGQIFRKGFRQQ